jgi:putative nucleotidyltransferase with HDIG domain
VAIKLEEIPQIYTRFHVPKAIIQHCRAVSKFAVKLAQKLNLSSNQVSKIEIAALLHDAFKLCDVATLRVDLNLEEIEFWQKFRIENPNSKHFIVGYEFAKKLGEVEIAEMILRHDFVGILDPKLAPRTLAEKIIYYSDKRVCQDQIVSLQERFTEGMNRYESLRDNLQITSQAQEKCFELERELLA